MTTPSGWHHAGGMVTQRDHDLAALINTITQA
jgi:hypothetical protein